MNPCKVYICGPMTGLPDHNLAEFRAAREALRARGFEVVCPGEMSEQPLAEHITDRAFYMLKDIQVIVGANGEERVHGIVLLDGWSASSGANTELIIAWQLSLPVVKLKWIDKDNGEFVLEDVDPTPERLPYSTDTDDDRDPRSICEVADSLINGARRDSYGHPLDDYTKVAAMITGLFHEILKPGKYFKPEHIPMIVSCMKLSREMNAPKRGNRIDLAGYAGVIDMICEERKRRMLAGESVIEISAAVKKAVPQTEDNNVSKDN